MKTAEEKLQRNFERQRMYQQRAIERQREKQANPEWRQAQYDKQRERQSRYIERAKNKPFKRGLKGRTPRAAERSLMDKIGALPCIACYVHGVINEVVSLHHIDYRRSCFCAAAVQSPSSICSAASNTRHLPLACPCSC